MKGVTLLFGLWVIIYSLFVPLFRQPPANKSSTNIGHIGFHIHSWNDLRTWEQGFRKGMQWMKIDLQWRPTEFCANQKEAISDTRGCFILSHNYPTDNTTVQFYTSQSLLNYITSDDYSHYFKQPDRKIYIGLKFEYDGDICDSSLNSQNWESLVDDLFTDYTNAIINYNLNLEFYLDGGAAVASCTAQKWRPWVKIWGGSVTDPAFIENNVADGTDRLVILDFEVFENQLDPAYWVRLYGALHYGKFSRSSYPYLAWEPANQETFEIVSDAYLNYKLYHQPGFLFSINIDPVLFQVFSASRTKNVAWNFRIDSGSQMASSVPFVSVIPSTDSYYIIMVYYLKDIFNNVYHHYYTYSANDILGTRTALTSRLSLTTSVHEIANMKSISFDTPSGSSNLTLLADSVGTFDAYQLDPSGRLIRACSGHLPNSEEVTYSAMDLFVMGNQIYMVQAFTYGQRDLQFQLNLFDPETCQVELCGSSSGSPVAFDFSSMSIAVGSVQQGTYEGIVTLSNTDNQIHAAWVSFTLDDTCAVDFNSLSTYQPMDIGTGSVVSSTVVNDTVMIMEVHGNGYCWQTQIHNKDETALLCDQQPVSVDNILGYNYGPVSAWFDHIQSNQQLNPCSASMISGNYDGGNNPYATLFSSIDGSKAGVIAVHQGTGVLDRIQGSAAVVIRGEEDCGLPISYNGIVMDAWPLPAVATF